ncbi:MAG: hypothetical protein JAZ07_00410 [Candidatus Thiodiazotropha endolucinida]|uniref:5'-3' exonuclease domain-containing protein n=1 Tax=Candidatus Thiodiazotropha taylori TaxID=2792791 RepID=A0A9E4K9A3_9GAMM|nr:hypothetical protein [Candidatus Thiodiazotropha taylori]
MSSIMVQIKEYKDKPDMVRHTIFNIIRKYNLMFREEYGQMVICIDSKNSWRREYFPEYKALRRKNRKEDKHDWKAIFEIFNQTKDELNDVTPFITIEVPGCEADDIIGHLCATKHPGEPIVIVSPDRDFVQLHQYPNVQQYSNLQKKWVKAKKEPVFELEEKIMKGDAGDGIPNVLSNDDVLIAEDKRQTPLVAKKVDMLIKDPEALGTTVARRVIRNRTLIDLRRTPEELKKEIDVQYNKEHKGSIQELMSFFIKHRMGMLLESLGDFETRNK